MAESIGTAYLNVTVNTGDLEVGVERAKRSVAGMSASAQAEYNKLNASEKRRVDSLKRQADMLGLTREQQLAYNIAMRSSGTIQQELLNRVKGANAGVQQTTKAFAGSSKSARELQFAMRGLPAQFTDIFTSLASGQRPMMVFLQQGGQLKDMFGGVRPALQAMGGALKGLISPLSVTATAVGVLALAWKQGEDRMASFHKAIALTGNFAEVTAEQMASLANKLADMEGVSASAASSALAKVAESGKFTGEQLELVSRAAVAMEAATGTAIDETVAKFAELKKAPVEALLKLNDAEHFLTEAQLERVHALQEEGREQEAAAEAVRIYADVVESRSRDVVRDLGSISKAWREVKESATGAWDAVVEGVAEADSALGTISNSFSAAMADQPRVLRGVAEQVAGLAKQYGILGFAIDRLLMRGDPFGNVSGSVATSADKPAAVDSEAERDRLKREEEIAERREKWFEDSIRYASEREQMEQEILRAKAEGLELDLSREEIERRVAGIRKAYADRESKRKDRKKPLTEEEKAARALERAYESQSSQLARQIALHGEVSRAAAMRYEVENGSLKGLQATLADGLISDSVVLDVLEYVEEIEGYSEDAARAFSEVNTAIRDQIILLGMTADEQEIWNNLAWAGVEAESAKGKEIIENTKLLQRRREELEGEIDMMDGVRSATRGIFDDLKEGEGVWDSLSNAAERFANTLFDIVASGVIDQLFGKQGEGGGGEWGQVLSGLFKSWFGGATTNAKGGVYESPSLSAYSGQIHDSPKLFAFANGAGVFGEAGPEAIMPLSRGPDGKLGVQASGAGANVNLKVEIINKGEGMKVERQETSTGPDGQKVLRVMVTNIVKGGMANGEFDGALGQSFGLKRQGYANG